MSLRDLEKADTDNLVEKREELMDLLTPNGNNNDGLVELLEIERELTYREN
jgi:hypothetical protein